MHVSSKLNAAAALRATSPGRIADGAGLYLQVVRTAAGSISRSFVQRYTSPSTGKRREAGLGAFTATAPAEAARQLREARAAAARLRSLVEAGIDPLAARAPQQPAANPGVPTFAEYAARYVSRQRAHWQSEKHGDQWATTLGYCTFGEKPIDRVARDDVVATLTQPWPRDAKRGVPMWEAVRETATRLRNRIEIVLAAGQQEGLIAEDRPNPARWAGGLKHHAAFAAPRKPPEHFAALPYDEVPEFLGALRGQPGLAALALELIVFTGVRTSECLLATWAEFDEAAWTIPIAHSKDRRTRQWPHRVPLSSGALDVLRRVRDLIRPESPDDPLFPGGSNGTLSNMSMLVLLKRMDRRDVTPHGFRSSLRAWLDERTDAAHDTAELCLGHAIKGKVEKAYRRGADQLDKRRPLMQRWADHCEGKAK